MSERRRRSYIRFFLAASPLALVACATPRMEVGITSARDLAVRDRTSPSNLREPQRNGSSTARIQPLPSASKSDASARAAWSNAREVTAEQVNALISADALEATIPPQSVPQFVDTVFGQLIQVPYTLGPGVAEMRDVVSLRGSVSSTKRSVFLMLQTALRDYGVTLAIENGAVQVLKNETLNNGAPLFIGGRASPEVPAGSRPVIQFFELKSIDVNSLVTLLQDAYPNGGKIKFTPRQDINTLVISGNARDVASAAQVIDSIDQPRYGGANVARINPVYWSSDRLVDAVVQTLITEGYQAGRGAGNIQRAVTFLAIPYTNQVLMFSNHPEAFERASFWIRELDQPSAFGDQENVFVYEVENTSAEELGRLVASVQTGDLNLGAATPQRTNTTPPPQPQQGADQTGAAQPVTLGKVTVDPGGNRLLYRGTPSEYQRWRDLVILLDTPPQQVLLEMTIAEVTLTDETSFGIEWFIQEAVENGVLEGGTFDGLGLAGGGLTFDFTKQDLQVVLNAISTNNNVNILSTPRLVARSGGEANFQVGTDVPIITSQRAAPTQVGGDTDVLQTVQYRQTGVLLNMRPTVYGDSRVDLKISQEVSSQQSNPNAAIGSPLILNRSVDTQVSLKEGATAVIGGLIQDNYTRGNTGVPLLKDIPFLGAAFRSDTVNKTKTELLILVTPYIIRTGDELVDAAREYSTSLNRTMARRGPHAYTLLPWGIPGLPPISHSGGPSPFQQPLADPDFPRGPDLSAPSDYYTRPAPPANKPSELAAPPPNAGQPASVLQPEVAQPLAPASSTQSAQPTVVSPSPGAAPLTDSGVPTSPASIAPGTIEVPKPRPTSAAPQHPPARVTPINFENELESVIDFSTLLASGWSWLQAIYEKSARTL